MRTLGAFASGMGLYGRNLARFKRAYS
jgi:hypothetical protein